MKQDNSDNPNDNIDTVHNDSILGPDTPNDESCSQRLIRKNQRLICIKVNPVIY